MKRIERVELGIQRVPTEAGSRVGEVLTDITHDLNGALSTFVMEVYSLQSRRRKIAQGLSQGADVDTLVQQLDGSLTNLSKAATELTGYISRVETAANALKERSPGEPEGDG